MHVAVPQFDQRIGFARGPKGTIGHFLPLFLTRPDLLVGKPSIEKFSKISLAKVFEHSPNGEAVSIAAKKKTARLSRCQYIFCVGQKKKK
jgi:hypothetical protein